MQERRLKNYHGMPTRIRLTLTRDSSSWIALVQVRTGRTERPQMGVRNPAFKKIIGL